jgi:RNA polymerase sigma factor (sigma-70 family)
MTLSTGDAQRFDQLVSPHLGAAYNLARWLTGNDSAAQDVVQESCLRAFKALHRFADGNARAWLLTIVRNQSYTWIKAAKGEGWVGLDEEVLHNAADQAAFVHTPTPETEAGRAQDHLLLERALRELPVIFREMIVLRELEELSYKEIATLTGVPIGTVMSRLARGREMLRERLRVAYA